MIKGLNQQFFCALLDDVNNAATVCSVTVQRGHPQMVDMTRG